MPATQAELATGPESPKSPVRGRLYELGEFRIDATSRLLTRDGAVVALTPKALDTLLVLVERQGQVVMKEDLLAAVWPDTFVGEATLTQNIYTLRRALATAGSERYIETIPRRGYRLTAPVRPVEGGAERPALAARAVSAIAVLPFQVLGSGEELEFLGLGMADALITGLSRLEWLTVRPTQLGLALRGGRARRRSGFRGAPGGCGARGHGATVGTPDAGDPATRQRRREPGVGGEVRRGR